ncbi:MAG TPA: FAD binding domain-containing protein, partial [Anaerolineaceae bacterium]|nr:FAD binding domain-containing protein [Anaerolineaceae bacterium]
MWKRYITVSQLEEATEIIAAEGISARIVAGATDLMLELEKGGHREVSTLVDISRVNGLNSIYIDDDGWIHLGPMVTHNSVIASSILRKFAAPLVQACWSVGSPQIRNRGTVAGNLITASPANDTITPLMAMGAYLVLTSTNGSRIVSLDEFYTGVRKTLLQPHEVLTDIYFPAIRENQKGIFIKYALRNAQAISLVN